MAPNPESPKDFLGSSSQTFPAETKERPNPPMREEGKQAGSRQYSRLHIPVSREAPQEAEGHGMAPTPLPTPRESWTSLSLCSGSRQEWNAPEKGKGALFSSFPCFPCFPCFPRYSGSQRSSGRHVPPPPRDLPQIPLFTKFLWIFWESGFPALHPRLSFPEVGMIPPGAGIPLDELAWNSHPWSIFPSILDRFLNQFPSSSFPQRPNIPWI